MPEIHLVSAATISAAVEDILHPADAARGYDEYIGFDTEQPTLDVFSSVDATTCMQFARTDNTAYVIPLRFEGSGAELNIPLDVARAALAPVWDAVSTGNFKLCGAHLAFDLEATHAEWHRRYFPPCAIEDCILRAWVADPGGTTFGRHFGLKQQTLARLGHEMTRFDELVPSEHVKVQHPRIADIKHKNWRERHFERLDPRDPRVQEYAAEDAIYARALRAVIELSPADELIYRAEMQTSENIRRYRANGMRVDLARAQRVYERQRGVVEAALAELRGLGVTKPTTRTLSIALGAALSRHTPGKPRVMKEKQRATNHATGRERTVYVDRPYTEYSCRAEVLRAVTADTEASAEERRIAELALGISTPKHDVSTYLTALLAVPDNGFLRFDVKQFGQLTARFSGQEPTRSKRVPWSVNMLTIPRNKQIKQCFGAPVPYWHVQLDLASEEPRALANLSRDEAMVNAFASGLDFHRKTASIIYDKRPEAVTDAERDIAKREGLATLYSQTAATLAAKYGQSIAWAQRVIGKIEGGYTGALAWREQIQLRALIHGHCRSGYGRRVPRDAVVRGTIDSEIEAMTSRVIQTTCADVLRIAIDVTLRWLDRNAPRSRLINCVHDSLDLHVHEEDLALVPKLQAAVTAAVTRPEWPLPMMLDAQLGHSWGQLYAWGSSFRKTFDGDILHADERVVPGGVERSRLPELS